jgi:hypothetical protein
MYICWFNYSDPNYVNIVLKAAASACDKCEVGLNLIIRGMVWIFTVRSAEKCDAFTRTKTAQKGSFEKNTYFEVYVTVHRDKYF